MDSCPDGMWLTDAQNLEKLRAKRRRWDHATEPVTSTAANQVAGSGTATRSI